MKLKKLLVAVLVFSLSGLGSCGGSGTQTLTYSETVNAYSTEGLTTLDKGSAVASTYADFTALDLTSGNIVDPETTDAKMSAFVTALGNYNTHVQTLGGDAKTSFPTAKDVGTLGIDAGTSLKDLHETLQAKKAECDALFAKVPKKITGITTTAGAQAKDDYDQCARELEQLAVSEGFKTIYVSGGGSVVGGAATGGAFIYIVGGGAAALLTGPGILVVAIGGVAGGKLATALYEYCTSSSDKDASVAKGVSAGNYCAAASVKGTTGQAMPINTTGGTGTLHVFVDGYAPVLISNVTITDGQTTTVTISPVALTDVTDKNSADLETANSSGAAAEAPATASDCSGVVSIGAANAPAAPAVGQSVLVTATIVPAVTGCTLTYDMVGTDGWTQNETLTSDASGQITFTIPGAATAGIHDVINITESVTGVKATVAYVFE